MNAATWETARRHPTYLTIFTALLVVKSVTPVTSAGYIHPDPSLCQEEVRRIFNNEKSEFNDLMLLSCCTS
jgi:hypothetical protein